MFSYESSSKNESSEQNLRYTAAPYEGKSDLSEKRKNKETVNPCLSTKTTNRDYMTPPSKNNFILI